MDATEVDLSESDLDNVSSDRPLVVVSMPIILYTHVPLNITCDITILPQYYILVNKKK